jgi:hypothetical protein
MSVAPTVVARGALAGETTRASAWDFAGGDRVVHVDLDRGGHAGAGARVVEHP